LDAFYSIEYLESTFIVHFLSPLLTTLPTCPCGKVYDFIPLEGVAEICWRGILKRENEGRGRNVFDVLLLGWIADDGGHCVS